MLNRPEQHNAMNTANGRGPAGVLHLAGPIPRAAWSSSPARGHRAFCAGGDLKERNGHDRRGLAAQHVIFEQAAMRLLRCPVPVIAAVEGLRAGRWL
jgi:enoyl-CoA hydratase/carnithine racemase